MTPSCPSLLFCLAPPLSLISLVQIATTAGCFGAAAFALRAPIPDFGIPTSCKPSLLSPQLRRQNSWPGFLSPLLVSAPYPHTLLSLSPVGRISQGVHSFS